MSANLLPTAYAKPGQPFYAAYGSGGGGGSAGPNLVVSSIVVNGKQEDIGNGGCVAFAYDFPFTEALLPVGYVGFQQGLIKDAGGGATNAMISAVNAGGNALTSDFGAGRIIVGSQGTGPGAAAMPTLFQLNGAMNCAPSLFTSTIGISSINGYDASKLISSIVGTW